MAAPVTIQMKPWMWDGVEKHGLTEKEAAEMLRWALEQVHVAAAVYAAVTTSRPKRFT